MSEPTEADVRAEVRSLRSEADCATQGGTFEGQGSDCQDVLCEPAFGACCLDDGSCVDEVTEDDCELEFGGIYHAGFGCKDVSCDVFAPFGACCFAQAPCEVTTRRTCHQLGGAFLGQTTDCTRCGDTGACCWAKGCVFETAVLCVDGFSGCFRGPDTTCQTVECFTTGACCFDFGKECVPCFPENECIAAGGVFAGEGTDCPCVSNTP